MLWLSPAVSLNSVLASKAVPQGPNIFCTELRAETVGDSGFCTHASFFSVVMLRIEHWALCLLGRPFSVRVYRKDRCGREQVSGWVGGPIDVGVGGS